MKEVKLALVGNPNCGKTTVFNLLTGSRQHVGNWPGVTVEKKEGRFTYSGREFLLIDLPGIYSLTPSSIEERIARKFIIEEKPDIVLNIIDGTSLERSMLLTTQIIDTGVPFIMAINMFDEVRAKGLTIDLGQMEVLLKTPVVGIVAKNETGIDRLLDAVIRRLDEPELLSARISFDEEIEQAIADIERRIEQEEALSRYYHPRWIAMHLLEGDKEIAGLARKIGSYDEWTSIVDKHRKRLEDIYKEEPDVIFTEERFGFIAGVLRECMAMTKPRLSKRDITEALDSILLNKYLSFLFFSAIIWLTFQLTFLVGGFFSYFIGQGVQLLNAIVHSIMTPGMLLDLFSDGIISGVGGILVFLPQIVILFLIIAILEDSGYMARVAFIMDRLMHFLGIHGKSFISLFMGIGCNVPGIMAARTLENEEDRKVTVLINPFMSCSARLPIYILISGIFFGKAAGTIIFFLYFLGILAAIGTAKLLKIFFFRKKSVPFVMELPPYRIPTFKSLLIHMWERSSMFLKKMGGVILVGSIIIWVLGYFPRTTRFSETVNDLQTKVAAAADIVEKEKLSKELTIQKASEQIEGSFIGSAGKTMEPFFKPLGFTWKEGVALLTGVVGKEIVVSTLSVLYGSGKEEGEVLKRKMTEEGITPVSALAFLVFVLLYVPCLATIAAILKETNSIRWTIFSILYGIGVGYLLSFFVNMLGNLIFRG